tara:strand:- start:804 stop:1151 length:348 start_codon:yes stop_codon:yes gene_type:complete
MKLSFNASVILSLILGFFITYKINYVKNPKSIQTRLQEVVLFTNDTCYHIHHWMWMSIIIISILIGRYVKNKMYIFDLIAFLVGGSLVDLLYSDWDIVKNNCHKKKIQGFFKRTA